MCAFHCQLIHRHRYCAARVMRVTTPHGEFTTPVFMPVGTRAGVNNMMPHELHAAHTQIILGGNTYHMLCAPGMEVIKKARGMHHFMGWHGPMLTDSGGFQVFSLSKNKDICTINENGASFLMPGTKKRINMTPQMSLQTQKIIGADIIMAFDQCTPDTSSIEEARTILTRTHRWLLESIAYHQQQPCSLYGLPQALFGIVQGGIYKELRCESAAYVASLPVDGVAIGGETIGFNMDKTVEVLTWIESFLPISKPRYSMGVGMSPQDLLDVVAAGMDMFDCVAPTRNARHGSLYAGHVVADGHWLKYESAYEQQRIQIKKACFANDFNPVIDDCSCYTCRHYSRAHLHHLYKQKANVFTALASIHNIHVLHALCDKMRAHIAAYAM